MVTTQVGAGVSSLTNLSATPGYISAQHLVADAGRGHALYTGKARLWQGDSVIEADSVDLDEASHTLVATGPDVRVFFLKPRGQGKGIRN